MKLRKIGAIALGLALGIVASAPASAASNVALERSGNTYHKAACAHNQPFGRVRCFAHVGYIVWYSNEDSFRSVYN
jgi:hypothetical protein